MNLSSDNRDRLEAQGFEIAELKGFEDHKLPLYTHKPTSDKKPGDIVLNARVGNPGSLDDGEATYLARKAFHGMFPWLPGEACMARQFQDITIPKSGDRKVEQSEPVMGCKWCRATSAKAESRSPDTKFGAAKKSASKPKSSSKPRSRPSRSRKPPSKSASAKTPSATPTEDLFSQAD